MTSRRWIDPRDRRRWEVSAGRVRRLGAPRGSGGSTVLSFHHLATPREHLRVRCCGRVEESLGGLGDQLLALCLDAAREGGHLWVHPCSGEVWWIRRRKGAGDAAGLLFRSARGEEEAPVADGREPADLDDEEIRTLLDRRTGVAGPR